MRHTGMLFLSRQRPHAAPARCGTFQLQLHAYDRIGPHQAEPWRVTWVGPEAQHFWQQHETELLPGTALMVELEAARAHSMHTRPPMAELQARVIHMALVPSHAVKGR
ncbi:MAG: hypothetical protein LBE51_08735 [Acidovorax sp.]|jgi:hypothetical protein|nr:hypothetical protein [Acidovorax sp.]